MSPKELLYIEDALGHEQQMKKSCLVVPGISQISACAALPIRCWEWLRNWRFGECAPICQPALKMLRGRALWAEL